MTGPMPIPKKRDIEKSPIYLPSSPVGEMSPTEAMATGTIKAEEKPCINLIRDKPYKLVA
jgi:hypothetical protein